MSDLPTPDVLRQRIEAEREAVLAYPMPGIPARPNRELARCESALRRLDRHGGDHYCHSPVGFALYATARKRCDDYRDLCAEYPA